MKKELIENAANSYAGIARPSFVNGEFDRNAIADAFEYGAQWLINNAWRETSPHGEELKRNVHVIARIKRGFCIGRFDVVGYFHEYIGFITQSGIEFPLSDILEYAYLDDINPKRKGGAQ